MRITRIYLRALSNALNNARIVRILVEGLLGIFPPTLVDTLYQAMRTRPYCEEVVTREFVEVVFENSESLYEWRGMGC